MSTSTALKKQKVPKGYRKIRFAADCKACPDCEEPWCDIHQQHYFECPCVGPDDAEERGYEITEINGTLYFRQPRRLK
jgi:hypothetical protein